MLKTQSSSSITKGNLYCDIIYVNCKSLLYPLNLCFYYSRIHLERGCITELYNWLHGEVGDFCKQMRGGPENVWNTIVRCVVFFFLLLLKCSRKVVNIIGNDYCICFRFNVQLRLIRGKFLQRGRSWSTVLTAERKGTDCFLKV